MTEVPKIVYDRLRAAWPQGTHPDADLLAAFAEQALSVTERAGILQHLSCCRDCREVVALALPATEVAAVPIAAETDGLQTTASRSRPPHRLSFGWPSLRWAALAAGIAVASAVLLVHPRKLNQAILRHVNPQTAATAQPASAQQTASSSVPLTSVPSSPTDQSALSAKTDESEPKSEVRFSKTLKARPVVTLPHAESGMLLANNKKDSGQADKFSAAPSASAGAFDYDARSSRAATETVETSGAAAGVTTEPSAENVLMARNETPRNDAPAIKKAKPALQEKEVDEGEEQSKAATAPGPARAPARNVMSAAKLASPASQSLAPHVTWAIKAGVLQRSVNGGQSWQDALHADHPLLSYASHDEDVWTGGQGGTLFHSADGGVTWVQVQPSIKARQLSFDITHIELRNDDLRDSDLRDNVRDELRRNARGPAEILLSTSNNEIWSSADGGKTWEKK